MGGVADPVLLGVALDDLGDVRVVSVRHPREQVVLDLVVEAADNPAENPVARTEVDGRLDLVHRPEPPLGGELFSAPIVAALAAEQTRGRLGSFDPAAAADLILGGVLMQALIDVLGHRSADVMGDRLEGMSRTILSGLRPTVTTHPTIPPGGPDDRR